MGTPSYALRQRIQETEFRKVGLVITPISGEEAVGVAESMRPDQKVAKEALPSMKRCPTRSAAYPLGVSALRAAEGVVALAAIVHPCSACSRKRRRRGGNNLDSGVREKLIELMLRWEMSRQFGIHQVADYQPSGLFGTLERPLRELTERCVRNQDVEQDVGIDCGDHAWAFPRSASSRRSGS